MAGIGGINMYNNMTEDQKEKVLKTIKTLRKNCFLIFLKSLLLMLTFNFIGVFLSIALKSGQGFITLLGVLNGVMFSFMLIGGFQKEKIKAYQEIENILK